MSRVFIGMPVFNGQKHIHEAIESVLSQTFDNWTLLISDNDSTDKTGLIAEKFAKLDKRIKYVRQKCNIGPVNNFSYVLYQCDSDLFVWMAADDIWLPTFLYTCIKNFNANPDVGLSFTNLDAIDSKNTIVRGCEEIPTLSGKNSCLTVLKYIFAEEISGKANLIYGVIRTEIAKKAWRKTILENSYWGQDMCFVLAAICQCSIYVDEKVCFLKRYSQPVSNEEAVITKNYKKTPYIPFKSFISYFSGTLHAASGTKYYLISFLAMSIKLVSNIFNGVFK